MNDFRDELSDFARQIDVPTGSAAQTMVRARRRTQRMVVTRVGAAALLVGVGVIGVRQLSTPGLEGDPIDTPNNVAAPNTATAVSGPAGTAVATGEGDGSDTFPTDDAFLESAPQRRPAEYTDLGINWNVYPADSPEALPLRFNPDDRYAIGTTTGSDGYFTDAVFAKTDNGWEEIEKLVNTYQYALVGDTLYAAVWSENPEDRSDRLRALDIPTRTWRDVPFPEGVAPTVPAGNDALSVSYGFSLAARGDKLMIAVGGSYQLDPSKLGVGSESDVRVSTSDGKTELVITDYACVDNIPGYATIPSDTTIADPPTTTSADNSEATVTDNTAVPATVAYGPGEDPYAACERRVDAADVGVTEDEIALSETMVNTLWTVSGDSWQPVQLPDGDLSSIWLSSGGLVQVGFQPESNYGWETGQFFAIEDDNSLKPLFDGHSFNTASSIDSWARPLGDTKVAFVTDGSHILTQDMTGDEWSATDLNTLGDGPGWGTYDVNAQMAVASPDGGVAVMASVTPQLPTEPTELTSGDYTIRWPALLEGEVTVTNNATGEQVKDFYVSTDSGQVKVIKFYPPDYIDGTAVATTTPEGDLGEETLATFDTSWADVPALASHTSGAVFVSPDGSRFDAIDADTLKGMIDNPPNGDLLIGNVSYSNGQVVVNASISSNDGGSGPGYVFVGTPS